MLPLGSPKHSQTPSSHHLSLFIYVQKSKHKFTKLKLTETQPFPLAQLSVSSCVSLLSVAALSCCL